MEECKQRHSSAMGYGCRGGDAANDRKKKQVVEDYKQQDYFWPIQFPLTGSLKLKIGHIVLVLSGWRYCCLMSLEHSDPSKIGLNCAIFLSLRRG
uniref:Uncharacterized protein n=1 Tax=Triticum urartu TaxID=4572 RepID=A0A8R7V7F7_TRIUA